MEKESWEEAVFIVYSTKESTDIAIHFAFVEITLYHSLLVKNAKQAILFLWNSFISCCASLELQCQYYF